VVGEFPHPDLPLALESLQRLPPDAQRKVEQALYWIRERGRSVLDSYRGTLLREYSAYWNAFECIIDAVNMLRPMTKATKTEKQKRIDTLLAKHDGQVTPQFIAQAFREVVDAGLRPKAHHALCVCFGSTQGEQYSHECFGSENPRDQLYSVRNLIDHGDIDAENPEELTRIQSRLNRLWMIVWGMFGRLVQYAAPVDQVGA
jgi:hypothetical protein